MRARTIFETPRLRARELQEDDLDFTAEMLGHPEVMRFWPRPLDREGAREWIETQRTRYREDGSGFWLLERRDAPGGPTTPIGQAGLVSHACESSREVGLGYIVHRPFWRRGYAFEASEACLRYGFDALGLEHIIALVRPENAPSRGLAEKLGMAPGPVVHYKGFEHIRYRIEADAARRHPTV